MKKPRRSAPAGSRWDTPPDNSAKTEGIKLEIEPEDGIAVLLWRGILHGTDPCGIFDSWICPEGLKERLLSDWAHSGYIQFNKGSKWEFNPEFLKSVTRRLRDPSAPMGVALPSVWSVSELYRRYADRLRAMNGSPGGNLYRTLVLLHAEHGADLTRRAFLRFFGTERSPRTASASVFAAYVAGFARNEARANRR